MRRLLIYYGGVVCGFILYDTFINAPEISHRP
eukprot:SAG11_NODE_46486_length_136_cov_23.054054_1_plen_31_part_10